MSQPLSLSSLPALLLSTSYILSLYARKLEEKNSIGVRNLNFTRSLDRLRACAARDSSELQVLQVTMTMSRALVNETLTTGSEPRRRRRNFTIWSVGLAMRIIKAARGSLSPMMILPEPRGLYVQFTHGASRKRGRERNAKPVAKMTRRDMDAYFTESEKNPVRSTTKWRKTNPTGVVLLSGAREEGMAGYRFRISACRRRARVFLVNSRRTDSLPVFFPYVFFSCLWSRRYGPRPPFPSHSPSPSCRSNVLRSPRKRAGLFYALLIV